MALARVQATGKVTAFSSTISATFAAPPTVGNAIILALIGTLTTCSDNHGNPYTEAADFLGNPEIRIFWCPAITATGTPFTVTAATGTTGSYTAVAIEVSGVGAGLAIDQIKTAGSFGTPAATGATPTLTAPEVFVVAGLALTSTGGAITVDASTPTWVTEAEHTVDNGTGEVNSRVVPSAAGTTQSATWTTVGTSVGWATALVAFKATAAGLARVQATPQAFGTASVSVTFATPPTVGNGIVVGVFTSASNRTFDEGAVSDNRGNAYWLAVTQTQALTEAVGLYFCPVVETSAAPFTVTLVLPGSSVACGAVAIEVSGVGTGLGLDRSISASSSSGTAPATGSTAALTVDNVFVVAAMGTDATQSSITVGVVSPVWTQEYERLSAVNGSPGEVDSRVLTGALGTTQSASWTISSGSGGWAVVLAAFRADGPLITARVSQAPIEVLSQPPSADARVSQRVVETLSGSSALSPAAARVTQDVVEVLGGTAAPAPPSGLTLVASASYYLDIFGGTSTPSLDTTGGDLIVVSTTYYSVYSPTITASDSKGNTWTPLTYYAVPGGTSTRLFYAKNATCGTGHTFTFTASNFAWLAISVFVFSGSHLTAPFDVENGAAAGGDPTVAGSITPSVNGCAVVSGFSAGDGAVATWPSGMTPVGGAAYVVQTTATAINPTWSRSGGSQGGAASVAAFKPVEAEPEETPAALTQALVETLTAVTRADLTQALVELLSPQVYTPAQISQALVEVLGPSATIPTRVTQLFLEVLAQLPHPTRITQTTLELYTPRLIPAALTQLAVELYYPHVVPARVTQDAVELYLGTSIVTDITQIVVEIFIRPGDCPDSTFPVDLVDPGGACPTRILD